VVKGGTVDCLRQRGDRQAGELYQQIPTDTAMAVRLKPEACDLLNNTGSNTNTLTRSAEGFRNPRDETTSPPIPVTMSTPPGLAGLLAGVLYLHGPGDAAGGWAPAAEAADFIGYPQQSFSVNHVSFYSILRCAFPPLSQGSWRGYCTCTAPGCCRWLGPRGRGLTSARATPTMRGHLGGTNKVRGGGFYFLLGAWPCL
jgi:hypothetical protein